jgi:hypothetical protein
VSDPSIAELARAITRLEGRETRYVSKDVYERDLKEIRADIHEIKDSVRWATRGVLGVFIAVVADIIIRVATQGIP